VGVRCERADASRVRMVEAWDGGAEVGLWVWGGSAVISRAWSRRRSESSAASQVGAAAALKERTCGGGPDGANVIVAAV